MNLMVEMKIRDDSKRKDQSDHSLDAQANEHLSTSLESRLNTPSICLNRNESQRLSHRLKVQKIQDSLVKVNTDRSSQLDFSNELDNQVVDASRSLGKNLTSCCPKCYKYSARSGSENR